MKLNKMRVLEDRGGGTAFSIIALLLCGPCTDNKRPPHPHHTPLYPPKTNTSPLLLPPLPHPRGHERLDLPLVPGEEVVVRLGRPRVDVEGGNRGGEDVVPTCISTCVCVFG